MNKRCKRTTNSGKLSFFVRKFFLFQSLTNLEHVTANVILGKITNYRTFPRNLVVRI